MWSDLRVTEHRALDMFKLGNVVFTIVGVDVAPAGRLGLESPEIISLTVDNGHGRREAHGIVGPLGPVTGGNVANSFGAARRLVVESGATSNHALAGRGREKCHWTQIRPSDIEWSV